LISAVSPPLRERRSLMGFPEADSRECQLWADSVVLRDNEAAQTAELDGAFERHVEVPEEGAPGLRRFCGVDLDPLTRHTRADRRPVR
jgi:hypothetical protein